MSPTRCRASGRVTWRNAFAWVVITMALPFLAGCPTANGPQPIMTASGPMTDGRTGALADNFNNYSKKRSLTTPPTKTLEKCFARVFR